MVDVYTSSFILIVENLTFPIFPAFSAPFCPYPKPPPPAAMAGPTGPGTRAERLQRAEGERSGASACQQENIIGIYTDLSTVEYIYIHTHFYVYIYTLGMLGM